MKILYRCTKVNKQCKVEIKRRECKLVDILRKGIKPDPALVDKYYGANAPNGAYRAVPNTRLILQDEAGNYIVIA